MPRGRPRLFTDAQVRCIRRERAAGASLEDLCESWSASLPTICNIVNGHAYEDAGGPITNRGVGIDRATKRKIAHLRAQGYSLRATAEATGVAVNTVRRAEGSM